MFVHGKSCRSNGLAHALWRIAWLPHLEAIVLGRKPQRWVADANEADGRWQLQPVALMAVVGVMVAMGEAEKAAAELTRVAGDGCAACGSGGAARHGAKAGNGRGGVG